MTTNQKIRRQFAHETELLAFNMLQHGLKEEAEGLQLVADVLKFENREANAGRCENPNPKEATATE